jgi:hypothetical protein
MDNPPLNLRKMFWGIGCVMLVVDLYCVALQLNFEYRAAIADGQVTGISCYKGCVAKVEFVDKSGKTIRFLNPHHGIIRLGAVKVFYFPGGSQAVINNIYRWDDVWMISFMVLIFFVLGIFFTRLQPR